MRQMYIVVASLALVTSAGAQETTRYLSKAFGYQYPMPIGTKIEAVTVVGLKGHVTIDPKKAKETAFIFVSYTCPTSMAYNDYLHTLYDEYMSRGVQFAFLTSNDEDGPGAKGRADPGVWRENVVADTEWAQLPPMYLDSLSEVANMVGAVNTPEVYIFDSTGTLRYRGAPTDGGDRTKDYTRWALDALLAGKPVAITTTPTFGCSVHPCDQDGYGEQ